MSLKNVSVSRFCVLVSDAAPKVRSQRCLLSLSGLTTAVTEMSQIKNFAKSLVKESTPRGWPHQSSWATTPRGRPHQSSWTATPRGRPHLVVATDLLEIRLCAVIPALKWTAAGCESHSERFQVLTQQAYFKENHFEIKNIPLFCLL